MWSNVFEIERFLVIYTEQYKRCQNEIPNKNSNSLIFRSVALFRQMSPFHFAHEFYRDLCIQKLSTRIKKKSALQNWYKFKCQKVGNFCVDICNCLRIIAKLKWASVKVSRQLWCRNCDDSRFERREREKNKNKKFHWKINVNEINDNNIAYDGDRPMFVFFVQKYVVFACLQWHQHSFYTRSQMERNE